jgi:hypothetical protein
MLCQVCHATLLFVPGIPVWHVNLKEEHKFQVF